MVVKPQTYEERILSGWDLFHFNSKTLQFLEMLLGETHKKDKGTIKKSDYRYLHTKKDRHTDILPISFALLRYQAIKEIQIRYSFLENKGLDMVVSQDDIDNLGEVLDVLIGYVNKQDFADLYVSFLIDTKKSQSLLEKSHKLWKENKLINTPTLSDWQISEMQEYLISAQERYGASKFTISTRDFLSDLDIIGLLREYQLSDQILLYRTSLKTDALTRAIIYEYEISIKQSDKGLSSIKTDLFYHSTEQKIYFKSQRLKLNEGATTLLAEFFYLLSESESKEVDIDSLARLDDHEFDEQIDEKPKKRKKIRDRMDAINDIIEKNTGIKKLFQVKSGYYFIGFPDKIEIR